MEQQILQKHSFISFIMQCCKAPENDLRKWLKKTLIRQGFSIQEDSYSPKRNNTDQVHNMLAIRGNPKVCLVAHTDVCREHKFGRFNAEWEDHKEIVKKGESDAEKLMKNNGAESDPVFKKVEIDGHPRYIITDRDNKVQVGGDDRLGVAINTWIALSSGYDVGLLFTTDEEIGLKSAAEVKFERLKEFELLVQVDRGNHSNELVLQIQGQRLCSYPIAVKLLEIALDIGMPRKPVQGMNTDVLAIKKNGWCKNAVNMTCGYHNSIGDSADEYIDVQEAKDTMTYVSEIVKSFYLGKDYKPTKHI